MHGTMMQRDMHTVGSTAGDRNEESDIICKIVGLVQKRRKGASQFLLHTLLGDGNPDLDYVVARSVRHDAATILRSHTAVSLVISKAAKLRDSLGLHASKQPKKMFLVLRSKI